LSQLLLLLIAWLFLPLLLQGCCCLGWHLLLPLLLLPWPRGWLLV
jgi:hypothetical protein